MKLVQLKYLYLIDSKLSSNEEEVYKYSKYGVCARVSQLNKHEKTTTKLSLFMLDEKSSIKQTTDNQSVKT